MCGRERSLFKTSIEGSVLNLCSECSKFGRLISAVKEEKPERKKKINEPGKTEKPKEKEIMLSIVPDYGDIIKKKREGFGLNQEEFAKKIMEKVSLIHKLETSQLEPPFGLAKKIERFLHIKLIEEQEVKPSELDKTKREHFTIGDFIRIKK